MDELIRTQQQTGAGKKSRRGGWIKNFKPNTHNLLMQASIRSKCPALK